VRETPVDDARPWRQAMAEALYGERGFYRAGPGAAGHFRTSVHASPLFAQAVLGLLQRVDAALGHPPRIDLVDVGAGRGELLTEVLRRAGPELAGRLRPHGVEVAPRPDGLPAGVAWSTEIPALTGLLVANEWLDNVPLDVAERGRLVLVDRLGHEHPGPPVPVEDAAWLRRWWPTGHRREIGRPRDAAWAGAVDQVRRGLAVAVDYATDLGARPGAGTLTGYRSGRAVPPVPDGSCDLTAHVALDACAAAGSIAGAGSTTRTTQRAALLALGISGARPTYEGDPGRYAAALQRASDAAELTDPAGLGGFGWLLQTVGIPPVLEPPDLRPAPAATAGPAARTGGAAPAPRRA